MTASRDTLTKALRLHRIGISVIPIGKEKKPAIKSWKALQSTLADEHQVGDWFHRRDDLGLAIAERSVDDQQNLADAARRLVVLLDSAVCE